MQVSGILQPFGIGVQHNVNSASRVIHLNHAGYYGPRLQSGLGVGAQRQVLNGGCQH